MSRSISESEPHLALPHVACSRCGKLMRITLIIPDLADVYEVKFACECGLDYQMSATATDAKRAL